MPSVNDIMQQERTKPGNAVLCFEEGLFLKAYEESAYRLSTLYGFKPLCKRVKAINGVIVSVGFPSSYRAKYLPGAVQETGKWLWSAPQLSEGIKPFGEWRRETVQLMSLSSNKEVEPSMGKIVEPMLFDIVSAVRSFPLENKTPLECVLFIAELKRHIANNR